jgi:hypothetical protein
VLVTGVSVVARYGNMPLTSPMAVSETLARTMIQNASRSMAGNFCENAIAAMAHGLHLQRAQSRF